MNNYWPFSVVPVLSKFFESIVNDHLFEYLEMIKFLYIAE